MRSFRYVKPQSLDDFGEALRAAKGRARVLAGGTHLIKEIKRGQMQPAWLIDIKGIDELKGIHYGARIGLSLGATTSLSEIVDHSDIQKHYPLLAENSAAVPSWQIRNRATLGGEIRTGSSSSAVLAALLCYDASCRVLTHGQEQTIPLHAYLENGFSTPPPATQLITTILLPPHTTPCYNAYNAVYQGLGRRTLVAGAAVTATMRPDGRHLWWVVLTGVSPYLKRLTAVEQALIEETPLQEVTALLTTYIQPEDTPYVSASYRLTMAGQMFQRSVRTIMAQIKRNAP